MHAAKAVGRNEMPFGRDIHVVLSNIVFDRIPVAPREGETLVSEPPTCIGKMERAAMPLNTKLL